MSEEKKRGLLGDILILVVIIGLALGAIYVTGNWPWFLVMLDNVIEECQSFSKVFFENVTSVTGNIDTLSNNASSM